MTFKTEVTEEQKKLAEEKADALEQLLREGLKTMSEGRLPEEGHPVLMRLVDLLEAIGHDPGTIVHEVFGGSTDGKGTI